MITRLLVVVAGVGLLGSTARAQAPSDQSSPSELVVGNFNPDDAVAPISGVEGPGVKIGEGTVIHPVFGVETGFVSNVFFTNTDEQAAGLLRLIAQVSTASLSTARLTPAMARSADDVEEDHGSFQYRAGIRASYDQYLSGNETVRSVGGLGLGASLHGLANAQGAFAFGFDEDFQRLIRAANFETDANTNRDLNSLRLTGLYQPHGRSIGGYLYYQNNLDIFERSAQSFADRMQNTFGVHPWWRVFPVTTAYVDVSIGYVNSLDSSSTKVSSFPLLAKAGIATLLSLKTTVNLEAGYTNGFYASGPSFSAPIINATIGYRYSPLGRIMAGYSLLYTDSVNANFYRDHVLRVSLFQLLNPFVVVVQPEIHFREYDGVTFAVPMIVGPDTRNDVIFALVAGAHYNFRNWIAATVDYRLSTDQTDYRYTPTGSGVILNPSYVDNELLAGVRLAM